MGSRLPSAGEVLIIPPAGIKGIDRDVSKPARSCLPGPPARKPGIPKQDPNAMRSRRNAWLMRKS